MIKQEGIIKVLNNESIDLCKNMNMIKKTRTNETIEQREHRLMVQQE